MIKLNIQFFGGDYGGDRSATADYDNDGFVEVPGVNNVRYTVPKKLFTKIDTDFLAKAGEEVREAKVMLSYYLTYGRYPTKAEANNHAKEIGLPGDVGVKPVSDAYNQYMIPALKDSITNNEIKDQYGRGIEKKQTGGWAPIEFDVVGKTVTGQDVYVSPKSGEYMTKQGSEYIPVNSYTDAGGNHYKRSSDGTFVPVKDPAQPLPGVTITDPVGNNPIDQAREDFNKYYNDLYSREQGTLGKDILDNNTSLYEKEAANAAVIAQTSMQAQAMQQAQAVKQVTDSLRAERSAQLRAGMSEAQLADREIQMLMGSVNQINQQAQLSSQEATTAKLAQNTAREQAFNDYITQTTALGQNAAANYASKASDVISQAKSLFDLMKSNGKPITMEEAIVRSSGYDPKAANKG